MYTVTAPSGASKVVHITRGWYSLQDAICELLDVNAEQLAKLVLLDYQYAKRDEGLLTARAAEAGLVTITAIEEALPCEGRRRRRPPLDAS
jgi:hypothetical protein